MAECCLPVPVPPLMTSSLGMSHRRVELKSSGRLSGQRSSSPDRFGATDDASGRKPTMTAAIRLFNHPPSMCARCFTSGAIFSKLTATVA